MAAASTWSYVGVARKLGSRTQQTPQTLEQFLKQKGDY